MFVKSVAVKPNNKRVLVALGIMQRQKETAVRSVV
jgi:hypothetical protein